MKKSQTNSLFYRGSQIFKQISIEAILSATTSYIYSLHKSHIQPKHHKHETYGDIVKHFIRSYKLNFLQ